MIEYSTKARIKLDFHFPKEMLVKKIYAVRTLNCVYQIQYIYFHYLRSHDDRPLNKNCEEEPSLQCYIYILMLLQCELVCLQKTDVGI